MLYISLVENVIRKDCIHSSTRLECGTSFTTSKPPARAIPQKLVNITNVKGLLNDYPTTSQVVNK